MNDQVKQLAVRGPFESLEIGLIRRDTAADLALNGRGRRFRPHHEPGHATLPEHGGGRRGWRLPKHEGAGLEARELTDHGGQPRPHRRRAALGRQQQ